MEASNHTDPTAAACQVLVLQAASQRYAVELLRVREIRRFHGAVRVPHADESLCGVVNVRGAIVPVLDLAARLGLQTTREKGRSTQVVVLLQAHLAGADRTVGLLAEGVSDVVNLPESTLRPPPGEHEHAAFVANLFTHADETVVLLSVDELLAGALPLDTPERSTT